MYLAVYLLYLFGCSLMASEASPDLENLFGHTWGKQGRDDGATGLPYHSPKWKRAAIKPDQVSPVDTTFRPDDYFGYRPDSIVNIENSAANVNEDKKHAYGVRLQSELVLTLCSAVTYVEQAYLMATVWEHPDDRVPVVKFKPEDLIVRLMTIKYWQKTKVHEILVHPLCDNHYDVDFAVLKTDPIYYSKNVWIHTAENILFHNNMEKVIAAQAVLGKCSVPVYSITQTEGNPGNNTSIAVDFVAVHFQNWIGCQEIVCPYWDPDPGQTLHQDPRRCDNTRNGTRFCMSWKIADHGFCKLLQGTPVFCDVGNIQGLMGLLTTASIECWDYYKNNAVMQGLSDVISWIEQLILVSQDKAYDVNIPEWLKNFRTLYIYDAIPKVKPKDPMGSRHSDKDLQTSFESFTGLQHQSIVNVYNGLLFHCRGVLVNPKIVLVPCSCVTYNNYKDKTDCANNAAVHDVNYYTLKENRFRVALYIDGHEPNVRVVYIEIHKSCDSHYAHDTAFAVLGDVLPVFKVAWLMTSNKNEFANLVTITTIADAAMGHDCYFLEHMDTRKDTRPWKKKIRFVRWTQCIHNICPNDTMKELQEERCYQEETPALDIAAYCITMDGLGIGACDITHGTPVFCNVEQTRGLIGFVTTSLDLNITPCYKRDVANQTAVVHAIHDLLPQFDVYTWIHEYINYRKSKKLPT